jgi:hypothetical protein
MGRRAASDVVEGLGTTSAKIRALGSEGYCACSRIFFDLRAPEKLRFGRQQPIYGRFGSILDRERARSRIFF